MTFRSVLFASLLVLLAVPAASAQPSLGFGITFGSGGPDGGRPESFLALSGGGAFATGALLLTADVEVGSASWTDGGGSFAFDPDTADLDNVDGYLCQNLQTGRYVDSGSCTESQARAALAADASLLVPYADGLSIGGGYRLGFQPTPYATLGYALGGYDASTIRLDLQVSQRYTGLSAAFQFGL